MSKKFALEMLMYTCPERNHTRAATLRSLGQTDWRSDFSLLVDAAGGSPSLQRMAANFTRALVLAAQSKADFFLLVEDDLIFNQHLEHNLRAWVTSFRPSDVGSLFRSRLSLAVGNQAIITSPTTWRRLLLTSNSYKPSELQPFDLWLRKQVPPKNFRTHRPSLVQHNAHSSTVKHPPHLARDFDLDWCAP